jgi:hypothetical protein
MEFWFITLWANELFRPGTEKRRIMSIEQLVAALMAFDPLLCREALAGQDWDYGRIRRVLDTLDERQPGMQWAVVDTVEFSVYVYDDLIEAAADYEPEHEFLAACKVEDGVIYLSMDGKWNKFEASLVF